MQLMANDTRSNRRSKDDESNSSKKSVNGKGLSTSGSATMDNFGLRMSSRETPSQKQTSSSRSTTPLRIQISSSPSTTPSRKQISSIRSTTPSSKQISSIRSTTPSLKQIISSPPTIRMSECLEKRTLTTTPIKRKYEIVEKQRMPSPLRRFDRGKKHPSLSSANSKKLEEGLGSSDARRNKLRAEKNVKQITLEAREISRGEKKLDPKPGVEKKRMDGRNYKSFFKQKQRRGTDPDLNELERPDKLSQDGGKYCGGRVSKLVEDGEDEDEDCSESTGEESNEKGTGRACAGGKERSHSETLGNHVEIEVSCTSQKHSSVEEPFEGDSVYASKNGQRVYETLDDAERVKVDCTEVEKLQTPELVGSACTGRLFDGDIDEGTGDRVTSKRKRHTMEMDCKASSTFSSRDICTSDADAVSPPSSECNRDYTASTFVTYSKKLRSQMVGKKPKVETDEVGKKHTKVVNNSADSVSPMARLKEGPGGDRGDSGVPDDNSSLLLRSTDSVTQSICTKHASASTFPSGIPSLSEVHVVESEEGIRLPSVQKNLLVLLEPEISKLCEILNLSEDVKVMVRRFLEYITSNHHINREPETIFQAFQISLCWIAASLLKYKIDKKESLALAMQHLNFGCTEEEANNMYKVLRRLKKIFLHGVEKFKRSESSKDYTTTQDTGKELPDEKMFQSVAFSQQNVEVEIDERLENQEFAPDQSISKKAQKSKNKIDEKQLSKSVKRIQKKCDKRMVKLILRQQEDMQEFYKTWEEENVQLEKEYRLDSVLVRSIHSDNPVRLEKLKKLDDEFQRKTKERKLQKDIRVKEILAKHLAEANYERRKAERWLEVVKSLAQDELSYELPLHESESGGTSEHRVHDGHRNVVSASGLVDEQSPSRMQASEAAPYDTPRTASSESVRCSIPIDTPTIQLRPNCKADAVDSLASHRVSMTAFEHLSNLYSSADAPDNNGFVNQHSSEQVPDGTTSSSQKMRESALNELAEGADFTKILNPDVESNREQNETDDLDISVLDPMAIPSDAAGSSTTGGSISEVQPVVTPAEAGASPQNLALQGEFSQSSTSSRMHAGDVQAIGNQNVLQQVEGLPLHSTDTGPTDQTNCEELLVERVEHQQLSPSTDSPVDHDQHYSHAASGVVQLPSEGHTASLSLGQAEPSNQAVPQPSTNLAPPPPIHASDVPLTQNLPDLQIAVENDRPPSIEMSTSQNAKASLPWANLAPPRPICARDLPLGQNQPGLQIAVENDHPPSIQRCTSSRNVETSLELVEDTAGIPNEVSPGAHVGMFPSVDIPLGGFGLHLPLHSAHQMTYRMPPPPLCADPLQNELERLHKEKEKAIIVHEDTKLRLKSDCSKEIEEIIAEIRRKYEVKCQEAEAAFLLKKTELDTYHNKVLMNKILAEAFHSKCLGTLRMQQVAPSNFMQQLWLPSLQPGPRPPSATGLPSDVSPAVTQQATAPLPVHVVRHSSPLLSSMPARPSLISPITLSTGNRQVAGEIRVPAPHLQPFRPSSPMSATSNPSFRPSSPMSATSIPSFPRGFPNQRNLPTTTPSVPEVPSRPPPPGPPPSYPPFPFMSAASIPFVPRGFPFQQVQTNSSPTSMSNTLLYQSLLAAYINPHPPNISLPLPDIASGFVSPDLPRFGAPGSGVANITSSGVATDIVCLSDED
ncbi:helicase protein MOM1-like isoform X3 [Actinidia eriantha]|uniref:helicase protein MOM1-like isoform X3 n=1 Tax=Actinidia eriantha TaxID=165200 RepID=UPI002589C480|nr:helicase protein MOM1-like isoform X3 [Actinidia eriantha]